MPSPIGHALAGAAVAWSASDRRPADDRRLTWTAALLAASADLDLLVPFTHRAYSHSVGAVLLILIVAAGVTRWVTPERALRVTLICGAAYATHLLLDWMAADTFYPYGIRALWPFTDGWYISRWQVFEQTARRHLFTHATLVQNAHAVAREVVIIAPIAAAIAALRMLRASAPKGPAGTR